MSPITSSAKKALRQNVRKRLQNLRKKRKIRRLEKELKTHLLQQKTSEAKKLLPALHQALDKAAKTGVIKKNKAARKKSQIARMLNTP